MKDIEIKRNAILNTLNSWEIILKVSLILNHSLRSSSNNRLKSLGSENPID